MGMLVSQETPASNFAILNETKRQREKTKYNDLQTLGFSNHMKEMLSSNPVWKDVA